MMVHCFKYASLLDFGHLDEQCSEAAGRINHALVIDAHGSGYVIVPFEIKKYLCFNPLMPMTPGRADQLFGAAEQPTKQRATLMRLRDLLILRS